MSLSCIMTFSGTQFPQVSSESNKTYFEGCSEGEM